MTGEDNKLISELWGEAGELWNPGSRLPDFSRAGVSRNSEDHKCNNIVADVKSYGAVGDGKHDDTAAFVKAIDAANDGVIFVPEGRFRLTDKLEISKSDVILRGEGPRLSILSFEKPLHEIAPSMGMTGGGRPTSNYSWSGGLVSVKGDFRGYQLANITSDSERGAFTIEVSNADSLHIGQRAQIFMRDDGDQSLADYLYSGDTDDIANFKQASVSFVATITNIDGARILFDRPMRYDIRSEWRPKIHCFKPTVAGVGIENLGFDFATGPYMRHFMERGFNAIAFSRVADSWVRDIRITNADSGLFIGGHFCAFEGIDFDSQRDKWEDCSGHHGVVLGGTDNLFARFRFNTRFVHDLCVTGGSAGNVFSNGQGVDLNFDHHRRAPHENLFTDIDVGRGTRIWSSGGGPSLGRHCGARGTFWNIRASRPLPLPPEGWGPETMNFVAVQSGHDSIKEPNGRWHESIPSDKLSPRNIYEAQLSFLKNGE